MSNIPLVSVIIPTHNSGEYLERCLVSLFNQNFSKFEVIIVDKLSIDSTESIAKNFDCKFIKLRANERSEQLNYGVKVSKGKYIYRIDSDFILEKNVIEEAYFKCENEGFDAVCIHNTSDSSVSFWAKVRKLERDCYKGDKINVAARFMTRQVFLKIGGFDSQLFAGEDYDLHNKLLSNSYKIGEIQSKEIHLGEPKTLKEIVIKHYLYGKNINIFLIKNRKRGFIQLNPLKISYLRNITHFKDSPIISCGFILYQFVRYSSSILGLINDKFLS